MYEEVFKSGNVAKNTTYTCTNCGYKIILKELQIIPLCPTCDNNEFTIHENFDIDI